jgi:hypothetical protein
MRVTSASAHDPPQEAIRPARQSHSMWDILAPRGLSLSERLDRADAEIMPSAREVLWQLGLVVAVPLTLALVVELLL